MSAHHKYNSKLQPTRCSVSWLIYFYRRSTCFRRFLRPSSGARNCTYSFRYCQPVLLLAAVVDEMGLFLFCAIDCINFHSVCCLSFVSSNETILVTWYPYAAVLCTVGWLDKKLMVVSVVVGFLNMSISRLEEFLIIRRSRKLIHLLFSCVGLSCRLLCIWFMYLWMVSSHPR